VKGLTFKKGSSAKRLYKNTPMRSALRVCASRPGEGHADTDANDRMISLQFNWGTERKEVSSIFIGTSPEFELALYTLCFVAGAEVSRSKSGSCSSNLCRSGNSRVHEILAAALVIMVI